MNFSERKYTSGRCWFDLEKWPLFSRMKPCGFMMSAKKLKHLFSLEQQALMNRSLRQGTFVNVNEVNVLILNDLWLQSSFGLISERARVNV